MASTTVDRSASFLEGSRIPTEELGEGITRQILAYGPDLMLVRVWFAEGAAGDVHSHAHTQASYIESGRFEVFIDGEKKILGAGDSFYISPHLPHSAACLDAGVILDTFSPLREDFLSAGDRP
jgi:quercetin dioxygenase-like cupin family protein